MPDSPISTAAAQPAMSPMPWRQLLRFVRGDIFVLAMFFSLLLIGGDLIAIKAGGLTMRVVFPLLMAALGFLYLNRETNITIPTTLCALFFCFAIAGAISTGNSIVVVKSLGYTIWVFFDFFVIIVLCYNLARLYPPEKVLSLWFMVFRIHVFLVIAEAVLHLARGGRILDRPHLWFYETSYMAIFLTAYFGSALYMLLRVGKPYRLDLLLSVLVLLVSASATAMFGMIFAIIFNFLVARQRLKLLLWSMGLGALFLGTLYLFFRDTIYFILVARFLVVDASTMDLVIGRGGNRIIRFLVGWGAFLHHPWTGVGIGGDTAYMDATPLPENSLRYVRPWLETTGQPFCNIFIEVLGTMGLVGFVPFCAILGYCGRQMIWLQRQRDMFSPAAMAFLMGFFCSILAMQFEGTMLRYYLWSPLGLAFGVIARSRAQASPAPERLEARPAIG
jgi:O-antigen ligase